MIENVISRFGSFIRCIKKSFFYQAFVIIKSYFHHQYLLHLHQQHTLYYYYIYLPNNMLWWAFFASPFARCFTYFPLHPLLHRLLFTNRLLPWRRRRRHRFPWCNFSSICSTSAIEPGATAAARIVSDYAALYLFSN